MESALLTTIEAEIRAEMQLAPSIPVDTIKQYIREGEATLNSQVNSLEVDFDDDLISRALLKNYVRYAYYGQLDDFFVRYKGDLNASLIRNII